MKDGTALRVGTDTEIALTGPHDGLILRHPAKADFDQWSAIRKRDAGHLRPWEPDWTDGHLSRVSYRTRLSRFRKLVNSDRAYPFHILHRDTQRLIGAANLTHVERGAAQSAKLGYWVAKAHVGQGIGKAVVGAITSFGFETLRLERIEAAVQPDNHPSIRVLESNAYQLEGTARGLLQINGSRSDHLVYSKLRTDGVRR